MISFLPILFLACGALPGNEGADMTPGAECDRKCGGPPLNCYFHFIMERYTILSPACRNCTNGVTEDCFRKQCIVADGYPREMLSINREFPGTPIVVCQNDTVIVDVDNRLRDLGATIHWHGIKQYGTPHMDGVPMVTQCPIQPFTIFRYRFPVPEAGTFFYHSHLGSSKLDGQVGALIVRGIKSQELHRNLYDFDLTEHVIMVLDWLHVTANWWAPGQHIPSNIQIPSSVLFNGRGPIWRNGTNDFVPLVKFRVQQGKRYRFRLIGSTCMNCLYGLKIQGHQLTVITADGGLNIKPIVVDTITVSSGERYDFVLNATNAIGSYYVYLENLTPFCQELMQVAVLEYIGSTNSLTLPPPQIGDLGLVLNPPSPTCDGSRPNEICVSDLIGDTNAPAVRGRNSETGYVQLPIAWDAYLYTVEELFNSFQPYEEPEYPRLARFTVNNITFSSPPSPFLTQFEDIPEDAFCDQDCYGRSLEDSCTCASYYSVPLNTIVDFIIYDPRDAEFNHPFHIHGTNFYVLAMGVFPSLNPANVSRTLKEVMTNARNDVYSLKAQPQKDTVITPARGWVLARFLANNPGFWLIHCHFVYHLDLGMATVLKIGSKMPPVPPNFPRCGNYLN